MKKISQPTIKKGVRYTGCQPFIVQQMPDPEGHLTEEQKKWPVVTELLPLETTSVPPPAEQQPQTPPAA